MFDAIAGSTLGAFGFFMPNVKEVRRADPTEQNPELKRDAQVGLFGAVGFSFLIAVAVAQQNDNAKQAFTIWMLTLAGIASAYAYAYYRG